MNKTNSKNQKSVDLNLDRFPRLRFAHLPTALEPMDNLSAALGGPRIWIKRDDCTGLAGGGNKTRKLEFLMAEAQAEKAQAIITHGATQSNHVRQTAAIAAKLGMQCHLLLEDRTGFSNEDYVHNGNVLLDQLFNATVRRCESGTDMNQAMQDAADELRKSGLRPYIMPGGGSNEVGALGYVHAADELLTQAHSSGLEMDHIVLASGSAGTHAGMLAGLVALGSQIPILGIGVRAPKEVQERNVFALTQRVLTLLESPTPLSRNQVVANCNYVGEGYGMLTEGSLEAIKLLANLEGILIDPVYTGKAMAGLVDLVRKGSFPSAKNIIFIHTGGSQALFGYRNLLELDPSTGISVD